MGFNISMRYRVGALLCFALASSALFSCGENEPGTVTSGDGSYTFTLREEKGGYFVSDYKGSEKSLLLPDYVKEGEKKTPVVGIDGYAFSLRPVETLELGKNIKYLSDYAFAKSSITSLYVTPALRAISTNAFADCEIMADYVDGVQYLQSRECPNLIAVHTKYKRGDTKIQEGCISILDNVFNGITLEVTLPSSIRHIGAGNFSKEGSYFIYKGDDLQLDNVYPYMFYGSSGVKNLTITEGITKLAAHTFDGCEEAASLYLPDGIESIEKDALPSKFSSYTVSDGVRYLGNKERTAMYCFGGSPTGINLTLLKDTKVIADGAFASNQGIWSLRPGMGFIHIGDGAFSGCNSLRKVDIPTSTKYIGPDSFSNCPNLELYTEAKQGELACDLSWTKEKIAVHYESTFEDFNLVPISPSSLYWESDKTLAIDVTQFLNDASSSFREKGKPGLYLSPATVAATVGEKEVKVVEITGKYGRIAGEIGPISISEDWDPNVIIRLNDLSYRNEKDTNPFPALEAKSDITLELRGQSTLNSTSTGQGTITGKKIKVQGSGTLNVNSVGPYIINRTKADAGILCDELEISSGTVLATGASGGDYGQTGWTVENGGNGITCKTVIVHPGASLSAIGGEGGLGSEGTPATSQTTHNETNGGNGGNGGAGLYCDEFTFHSGAKVFLIGGAGGKGGDGGNGTTATGASANGTNGGNGGNGGAALSVLSAEGIVPTENWSYGRGGDGGAAGKKGDKWAGMQFGSDGNPGKQGAAGTLIVTH
ncbi:MAG: hypothetical protein E7179_04750 [Erysipelotrichaceae bacterium]|nr:hypothetical protein [Erysipelotrichaceae bacterium]